MFILTKNKLLLFFFLFRLLMKYNNNKYAVMWLYFKFINLKYNHIYYYILNLLRTSNIKLLLFFFSFKNIIFYKIYRILYFIEFDNINFYFVRFKSSFFCNWRFLQSSFIDYDNFNLRVSFLLYFRYTKYIEYFRTFKYYEYLSRWSIFGCKNRLFKRNKYVNMNNFIIYISDVIYVRNFNLLFNFLKTSKIYKYCKINMNCILILQYLYKYFLSLKNIYGIYLLKYLYDFTNYFFVRDCLFKYKHFEDLNKLGEFCWFLELPYENYFNAKSYVYFLKKIYYNTFFDNYSLNYYYISFLKSNIRLYRLGILNYFALAFFKYVKYLSLNESLRINFVMLWAYYNEYDCFEFAEFNKILFDLKYYKFSIFFSLFSFMTLLENMPINFKNWKLYHQIDLNYLKFYFWFTDFISFFLLNFKYENYFLFNFFFEIYIKIMHYFNNFMLTSLIFTEYYIFWNWKIYIFKIFQEYRLSLQKYIKFVSYYNRNKDYYIENDE